MINKNSLAGKKENYDKNANLFKDFQINWLSGMIAGTVVAGVFNPWDRALYLVVKHEHENRHFLNWKNFKNPYQGVMQTLVQRSFMGGLYFALKAQADDSIVPHLKTHYKFSDDSCRFAAGSFAGSISGLITNPISAVKYHMWGKEKVTFLSGVKTLLYQGGARRLITGSSATVTRDMIFGSVYEVMRHLLIIDKSTSSLFWLSNGFSAILATILSSPFNYVRNKQYSTTAGHKVPHTFKVLEELAKDSKTEKSVYLKARFFQNRLRIGWGTLRVGAGIMVGQELFDRVKEHLR